MDLSPIQKSTVRVRREGQIQAAGASGFWNCVVAKKPSEPVKRPTRGARSSLSVRLEAVRYLNTSSARRTVPAQHIADALVGAGYASLDEQAKALGLNRSTAWTIIRTKHKLGYLNSTTTKRMLANSELPPCIRDVLQRYVADSATEDK